MHARDQADAARRRLGGHGACSDHLVYANAYEGWMGARSAGHVIIATAAPAAAAARRRLAAVVCALTVRAGARVVGAAVVRGALRLMDHHEHHLADPGPTPRHALSLRHHRAPSEPLLPVPPCLCPCSAAPCAPCFCSLCPLPLPLLCCSAPPPCLLPACCPPLPSACCCYTSASAARPPCSAAVEPSYQRRGVFGPESPDSRVAVASAGGPRAAADRATACGVAARGGDGCPVAVGRAGGREPADPLERRQH